MDAGQLAHALSRLDNTARVLYVAAHPDDENTRLLAYLANARHVTGAYLSMTRGGGGQNLIGREQDELLDVLRTEELLAARSLDAAVQRFSRARDFGYSKTPKETLEIWGHDKVLADVVWVIRTFQPDVIITRFDEKPPNHGHHTASAILAREAFGAAADPQRFPEQLARGARVWQATRLLYNVSHWKKEPLPPNALSFDVGGYDARLGLSYGELAARSRTQHKSQGFGVQGERGEVVESLVPLLGSAPEGDLLSGIDVSWKRYGASAEPLVAALALARQRLHRDAPERALPALLEAKRALLRLPDDPRVRDAKQEVERVIMACLGLFTRATSPRSTVTPGEELAVAAEVVLRRPAEVVLDRVIYPDGARVEVGVRLAVDKKHTVTRAVRVAADAAPSEPYFLRELRDAELDLVGQPKGPAPLSLSLELRVSGEPLLVRLPLEHSETDRVHGERVRMVQVVPPLTVTPERDAVLFVNGRAAAVSLRVRAGRDAVSGQVRLRLPDGYRVSPEQHDVDLARAGQESIVSFSVTPPTRNAARGAANNVSDVLEVTPTVTVGEERPALREDLIDYPHIPPQLVLRPSKLRLARAQLSLPKGRIGYIEGSGDTLVEDLTHVGVQVTTLDDETLRSGSLASFSAILVGIRAYNTRAVLRTAHPRLMRYVEQGGTLVVQYNTHSSFSPLEQVIGPYPLELGRERVTDETAEVRALLARDPLLTGPNRIGPQDFEGWVQERGLYFASKWDARYRPLFEMADPGEAPLRGSTLVAKHGRGRYVYTGLSFFRQLPAGVVGGYRLLLNLLSRESP